MNKRFTTAAIALALGLVWTAAPAMAQQSTTEKVKDKAESAKDKVEDKTREVKDKVMEKATGKTAAERAAEKAEKKAEKAADKTDSTMDRAKDKAAEMKDKVKDKMQRGDAKAGKADIVSMQQALKDKGFDPGPIDGVHGPRTTAAVRDFQKAENVTVTGQLDDATRAKLNMTSNSSASSASPATDTTLPAKKAPQQ